MPDSPKRDPRTRPPFRAPFGWAAILTLILAGAIFLTDNLHRLPSNTGEFLMGVLLLPFALVFVWLRGSGVDFLVWLSGVPDWLLFVLMTVDAYVYSLILMILIWIIVRLAKAGIKARHPAQ